MIKVSVIIPVYNIGEYIEQCMESVTAQTLRDIEIILINDGSTDDSAERCRVWAEKDARIRFFDRENRGVSASRNQGIELARGKYIAFVDPDDWLDESYLEKLYEAAEESGAAIAECDIWRYNNRNGSKIYRSCYGVMGQPYTLREHMKYGPTATYKSVSRKTLWTENGVRMPDCAFESPAVYSLMLALSGKVASVREPLYYYRRFRENSLIETGYAGKDGTANNTLGIEAMDHLIGEFRRTGLYDEYKDALPGIVTYRLNDILAMQFHRKPEADFKETVRNFREFIGTAFPDADNSPYITLGGYNLNRILTHMDRLHDPYCRFNFTSIEALMSGGGAELPVPEHKNKYRRMMLEREFGGRFWDVLAEVKPKYIFMDLIEERFDLLETESGMLTMSDAFEGSSLSGMPGRVIPRLSDECGELFKKCAETFVRRVKESAPEARFVIIKNLLAESVGGMESREPFADTPAIRNVNAVLKEYYEYLEGIIPDGLFIDPTADELYFTDRNYEYGAVPSHLNEIENRRIAARLEEMLK